MAEKNNKNDSDITKNNLSRQIVHSINSSIITSRQTDDSEMKMINASDPTKNINTGFKDLKIEDCFDKKIQSFPSVSEVTSSPSEGATNEQPSASQATSSLKDMQINPQGGGVTSRKPTLEDIFAQDYATVGQLLQEKKYDEAYGVSRQQIRLDPAVSGSKDLVNHYRCCMLAGEAEEAIRTRNQLKSLFKEKFQTTPNKIKTFADTIRGEGKDMEANLFSEIADDFMKPGSHGGVTSLKPTLKDIFPESDAVGQLVQEKMYGQAFGVSRRQIKLDPAVIGSKDLVNHYRCCMLAEETEEAIRTKDKLKALIKEKSQTTPNEIENFADTIRGEGRDMEAILIYQIAAEFYGNQSLEGLVGIADCVKGVYESTEVMLSRDKGLKPIVRTHVISLMRDMREMIRRSDDVSEEGRCFLEVKLFALYRIE
nr:uncharacterized protein LOC100183568 [Ciona intestinalis]|eukprot:XP_002127307.1 uncharacterized protein LOC100183568 [Ciona intestinalis]